MACQRQNKMIKLNYGNVRSISGNRSSQLLFVFNACCFKSCVCVCKTVLHAFLAFDVFVLCALIFACIKRKTHWNFQEKWVNVKLCIQKYHRTQYVFWIKMRNIIPFLGCMRACMRDIAFKSSTFNGYIIPNCEKKQIKFLICIRLN